MNININLSNRDKEIELKDLNWYLIRNKLTKAQFIILVDGHITKFFYLFNYFTNSISKRSLENLKNDYDILENVTNRINISISLERKL